MNHPTLATALSLTLALASGCSSRASGQNPLGAEGPAGQQAVAAFVERGDEAIPDLKLYLGDPDPLVRYRAKTALGKITGQWGADGTGLHWERSLADAIAAAQSEEGERPIVMLHLFGKLDEEFC